jgi:hypothetical protein
LLERTSSRVPNSATTRTLETTATTTITKCERDEKSDGRLPPPVGCVD